MDGARAGVRRGAHPPGDPTDLRGHRGVAALTVRVVAAGRTGPNRDLRFGSEHSDLDETGRRDCRRLVEGADHRSKVTGPVFCGPEASVVQTAGVLGLVGVIDEGLGSLDLGRWRGRLPEDIPVGELRAWFTDVSTAPHGGESIADLVARVGRWFDTHIVSTAAAGPTEAVDPPAVTVVVAMPVVQALIAHVRHGGPDDYWSVEVVPASEHVLSLPVDNGEDRCHSGEHK